MSMWCMWCLSGQCVHIGSGQIIGHGLKVPVPAAVTIQGGNAYCADCFEPYASMIKERVRIHELAGMRPMQP